MPEQLVVSMEVRVGFPQTVCAEEVVKQANDSVPCVFFFINVIIDLYSSINTCASYEFSN